MQHDPIEQLEPKIASVQMGCIVGRAEHEQMRLLANELELPLGSVMLGLIRLALKAKPSAEALKELVR